VDLHREVLHRAVAEGHQPGAARGEVHVVAVLALAPHDNLRLRRDALDGDHPLGHHGAARHAQAVPGHGRADLGGLGVRRADVRARRHREDQSADGQER